MNRLRRLTSVTGFGQDWRECCAFPKTDELDWVDALINLFSPNLVKLGMGAALICMLTVTAITPTETEAIAEFEDPLVTLYPDQAEWSDWL